MISDYAMQKSLEALQDKSVQMVQPKFGECPILALQQQVIDTLLLLCKVYL